MIKKLLVLSLLVACAGCAAEVSDTVGDAGPPEFYYGGFEETCGEHDRQLDFNMRPVSETLRPSWAPTCFFPVQGQELGRYLNDEFDPYEITVETSDMADLFNFPPYEVAELAHWMVVAHKDMDLPCKNGVLPYEWLSKGHFVVTGDNDVFAQLYDSEDEERAANILAFIRNGRNATCYETPEGVFWSSVIRRSRYKRNDVSTVVHEMVHMMSIAVNGHSDGKHLDERLWAGAGGDTSLMSIVIKKHDCTYNPILLRCNP